MINLASTTYIYLFDQFLHMKWISHGYHYLFFKDILLTTQAPTNHTGLPLLFLCLGILFTILML